MKLITIEDHIIKGKNDMEQSMEQKEQECVGLINWMHTNNWYKWTDEDDQIFTVQLVHWGKSKRQPDNFDLAINDVNYTAKNRRELVFDFQNRVCKWNTHYKVYETSEKVLASSGSCSWNKIINALLAYCKLVARDNIKYNCKREEVNQIHTKYHAMQEAEIKTVIDAELEKVLALMNSNVN